MAHRTFESKSSRGMRESEFPVGFFSKKRLNNELSTPFLLFEFEGVRKHERSDNFFHTSNESFEAHGRHFEINNALSGLPTRAERVTVHNKDDELDWSKIFYWLLVASIAATLLSGLLFLKIHLLALFLIKELFAGFLHSFDAVAGGGELLSSLKHGIHASGSEFLHAVPGVLAVVAFVIAVLFLIRAFLLSESKKNSAPSFFQPSDANGKR